jgi:O-antigen/teichoic acid export membrane protein
MTGLHRPIFFSFIDRYSVIALNLLMTMIIARLMTPDEIGVFVIGGAIVLLMESLREFGVSSYLIQVHEITEEGVRTAFTVILILSLIFAIAIYLLADPVARFYGDQRIVPVLHITAFGFLFGPFVAPNVSLLRRDLSFGSIALINISGAVANFACTLTLAVLGAGYLSLAWGALASSMTIAVVANVLRRQFWIFRPSLHAWRKVAAFGGYSSAAALVNVAFQLLPQLALGRILSLDAVGIYSRAVVICQLPDKAIVGALQPLFLPALAAQLRTGGNLKEIYLLWVGHLTAILWPGLICLALLANPIVAVLLGPQWSAVAPLVRFMAIGSLFLAPAALTYPVVVSAGRVRDTLTMSLVSLPISAMIVSASSFIGLNAVAASVLVTAPFQLWVALSYVRRCIRFAWIDIAIATRKSALVTLCTASATVAFGGFRFDLSITEMAVALTGAAAGWFVGLALTGHPLLRELRGFFIRILVAVNYIPSDRTLGDTRADVTVILNAQRALRHGGARSRATMPIADAQDLQQDQRNIESIESPVRIHSAKEKDI